MRMKVTTVTPTKAARTKSSKATLTTTTTTTTTKFKLLLVRKVAKVRTLVDAMPTRRLSGRRTRKRRMTMMTTTMGVKMTTS